MKDTPSYRIYIHSACNMMVEERIVDGRERLLACPICGRDKLKLLATIYGSDEENKDAC